MPRPLSSAALRLPALLAPLAALLLLASLLDAFQGALGSGVPEDDITLVVVEVLAEAEAVQA